MQSDKIGSSSGREVYVADKEDHYRVEHGDDSFTATLEELRDLREWMQTHPRSVSKSFGDIVAAADGDKDSFVGVANTYDVTYDDVFEMEGSYCTSAAPMVRMYERVIDEIVESIEEHEEDEDPFVEAAIEEFETFLFSPVAVYDTRGEGDNAHNVAVVVEGPNNLKNNDAEVVYVNASDAPSDCYECIEGDAVDTLDRDAVAIYFNYSHE